VSPRSPTWSATNFWERGLLPREGHPLSCPPCRQLGEHHGSRTAPQARRRSRTRHAWHWRGLMPRVQRCGHDRWRAMRHMRRHRQGDPGRRRRLTRAGLVRGGLVGAEAGRSRASHRVSVPIRNVL